MLAMSADEEGDSNEKLEGIMSELFLDKTEMWCREGWKRNA
jgi:hypothetical protein